MLHGPVAQTGAPTNANTREFSDRGRDRRNRSHGSSFWIVHDHSLIAGCVLGQFECRRGQRIVSLNLPALDHVCVGRLHTRSAPNTTHTSSTSVPDWLDSRSCAHYPLSLSAAGSHGGAPSAIACWSQRGFSTTCPARWWPLFSCWPVAWPSWHSTASRRSGINPRLEFSCSWRPTFVPESLAYPWAACSRPTPQGAHAPSRYSLASQRTCAEGFVIAFGGERRHGGSSAARIARLGLMALLERFSVPASGGAIGWFSCSPIGIALHGARSCCSAAEAAFNLSHQFQDNRGRRLSA